MISNWPDLRLEVARFGRPDHQIPVTAETEATAESRRLEALGDGRFDIGATAQYVTEDLDDGPIIEPDVIRVTHARTVEELTRLGADIERTVLPRAATWPCEDRALEDGSATVVL